MKRQVSFAKQLLFAYQRAMNYINRKSFFILGDMELHVL